MEKICAILESCCWETTISNICDFWCIFTLDSEYIPSEITQRVIFEMGGSNGESVTNFEWLQPVQMQLLDFLQYFSLILYYFGGAVVKSYRSMKLSFDIILPWYCTNVSWYIMLRWFWRLEKKLWKYFLDLWKFV